MAANDYCFVTRWRVEGTPDEVFDVLDHPLEYVRWWPSVWLRAELLAPGHPTGIGRRVRFQSRGRLPYTLQWTAETIAVEKPAHIAIRATGDFDGAGEWRLVPAGPTHTEAEYRWTITANKPLLKRLSPVLRPVFEWNHRWAMARGEESLQAELRRRHTARPPSA